MKRNELYKKALTKWGEDKQLDKWEEELTELLLAIKRHRSGRDVSLEDIVSEMVDVEIMNEQGMKILGIDQQMYYKAKRQKKVRLEKRLK